MSDDIVPEILTEAMNGEGPTILIPKKNVAIDSQILSTIMACARKADFTFNMNLVSAKGKSKSLEKGSIVHVYMREYYKAIIAGTLKKDAHDLGIVAAKAYAISEEVRNTPPDERAWAIETCNQYFDFYKNDSWIPLEVEKVKGRVLYEDDEVRILYKVKYDLISDTSQGIYPIDTKTMAQRRDTLTLNNQFMGQCIVQGTRIMICNKVGFQKSLKPAEKFERAIINYSYDRLKEWQSEILPYYVKLMLAYSETGYWPPNFTHCENKYGFCIFKGVCESDRNMRESELQSNFVVGEAWDIEDE
jgi:hypothetical protein